jgi:hypothetical protein
MSAGGMNSGPAETGRKKDINEKLELIKDIRQKEVAIEVSFSKILMASQKLTNYRVAAIVLFTAAYLSTPHSSTIARLVFGSFCLAIRSFAFLRKHHY